MRSVAAGAQCRQLCRPLVAQRSPRRAPQRCKAALTPSQVEEFHKQGARCGGGAVAGGRCRRRRCGRRHLTGLGSQLSYLSCQAALPPPSSTHGGQHPNVCPAYLHPLPLPNTQPPSRAAPSPPACAGFLVLEGFASPEEVARLHARCTQLVDAFDPASSRSVFTTHNQQRRTDQQFLDSAGQVSFFWEEKAVDEEGRLLKPKDQVWCGLGGWGSGGAAGCGRGWMGDGLWHCVAALPCRGPCCWPVEQHSLLPCL